MTHSVTHHFWSLPEVCTLESREKIGWGDLDTSRLFPDGFFDFLVITRKYIFRGELYLYPSNILRATILQNGFLSNSSYIFLYTFKTFHHFPRETPWIDGIEKRSELFSRCISAMAIHPVETLNLEGKIYIIPSLLEPSKICDLPNHSTLS